mgnify:CR=1 FL=1
MVRSRTGTPTVKKSKITALIPAFNEQRHIGHCLASVRWADEVLVVDSFSSDRTPEIARAAGARVLQHEYLNSATQKNWAIPRAAHPWVLIVDADERVPESLRDEILDLLARDAQADPSVCDGYRIGRLNHFLGRRVRFSGWRHDTVLRLFRRDLGRYQDRQVHADIILRGRRGRLRNKLLHYTFSSFDQYMEKFDRYTTWAARDRAARTARVRWHHLTLRPLARFFKQYVLKLGFLDGRVGLVICTLSAFSAFMKYAKLLEMQELGRNGRHPTPATEHPPATPPATTSDAAGDPNPRTG